MRSRFETRCLVACLFIALGLRLAVILYQPDQLTRDRDAYLGIATSIADGRGFSSPNSSTPTAFRPPLYPMCLALGFRVLPHASVVAGINLLTGLLTVWLTTILGERLQLGRYRFVAGLIVAVDPLLLQYASRPMTESLCTFLAALWLWAMVVACPDRLKDGQRESENTISSIGCRGSIPWRGLCVGLAFGLLVLSRPTFWPIACFCGISWITALKSRDSAGAAANWTAALSRGIWPAIGTAVLVVPWLFRNWRVFGVPILTTTHGGYTLLLGNNPVFYEQVVRQPWGSVWSETSLRDWEADRRSRFKRDTGSQSSEVEEDAWNSRQAKLFVFQEPWHCVQAVGHRIRSLWNTGPQGDAAQGMNPLAVTATSWFYGVVLTTGLLGLTLVLMRQDRGQWLPLYALVVSVQLVHLMYWTNTRMRAPLTPALALFAVSAIPRNRARDTTN